MKKTCRILALSIVLLFVAVSVCGAVAYRTTKITDNTAHDAFPDINDEGQIAWGSDGEIFVYDGAYTTQITNNTYGDSRPQIGDGFLVWLGNDGSDDEVFLYDQTSTTQLTDNTYDEQGLRINAGGAAVWFGGGTYLISEDDEIFLYDGTGTTQLTNNAYDDHMPQINDNGLVVWSGNDGSDFEIFLYDGTSTTQLTNNAYDDELPQINANGYVVWSGSDGSDKEIFLYDGTSTTQITDNSRDDEEPQINDNGYVLWRGGDELFLFDGTNTTQITNNVYYEMNYKIDNNGHLAWIMYDAVNLAWQIFAYRGGDPIQITDDSLRKRDLALNVDGIIVWIGDEEDQEVFMAEPIPSATVSSKDLTVRIPGSKCFRITIDNPGPWAIMVSPSINWLQSAPEDVTFTGQSVLVDSGQSKTVDMPCVQVGSNAQPGDYDFDIVWTGTDQVNAPVEITTDPTLHLVYGSQNTPVGGTASMADKTSLLMPWVGMATLILVSVAIILRQRLRKEVKSKG